MKSFSIIALRVVLVAGGLFIVFTGANIGFGGITKLGWLGSNDFLSVTDAYAYGVEDSHTRFLGGLWLAVGLLLLVGASNIARYGSALKFAAVAIFVGGLMRFSQLNLGVIFGPNVVGSLAAELIGMPLLYLWLQAATLAKKP